MRFKDKGQHVRCDSLEQRMYVLENIHDLFPEWKIQEELMDGKYVKYFHPGFSSRMVVAYMSSQSSDILYKEFVDMVESENSVEDMYCNKDSDFRILYAGVAQW